VVNFRDWGIPLGRRFRALKLWFVLRHFGVAGLQQRLRAHLEWTAEFTGWVADHPDFELLAPVTVNTVCFRWRAGAGAAPPDVWPPPRTGADATEESLDRANRELLGRLNQGGRIYLTHTKLGGRYTLRLCVGQTGTQRRHVVEAWDLIRRAAADLAAPEG
jgi:aromatic-L-amino-acid decarboxylase